MIGNLILIITAVVLEQVDTQPVADAAAYEAKLLIQENQLQPQHKFLIELIAQLAGEHI